MIILYCSLIHFSLCTFIISLNSSKVKCFSQVLFTVQFCTVILLSTVRYCTVLSNFYICVREELISGKENCEMNTMCLNIPPLSKDSLGEPYRLSGKQKKMIRSLVRKECCNYDSWYGECLGPDRAEDGSCIQLASDHLVCRWMEHAVLPLDPALCSEIVRTGDRKRCKRCGSWFFPGSNRALYCPTCAAQVRKEHKRESARKKRQKP